MKVDERLFVLKPLHAQRTIEFFKHYVETRRPSNCHQLFQKAGISETFEQASTLKDLALQKPFQVQKLKWEMISSLYMGAPAYRSIRDHNHDSIFYLFDFL